MLTYIDIHTHKKDVFDGVFIYNLNATESPDFRHCSLGLHPWDIGKYKTNTFFDKLNKYCEQDLLVAVGEIGIDRAIDTPVEEQIEMFIAQHEITEKYKLPIIIHCVKAWSDLLGIRNTLKTNLPWIFHGYNGNLQTAHQLILKDCYISFGDALFTHSKVQKVFKEVHLEWVFLETDNSEKKIEEIYQKAADLRHICVDNLKIQLYENFKRVFTAL